MSYDQEYKLAMRLSATRHAIRETNNRRLAAALHRQAAAIQRELRHG